MKKELTINGTSVYHSYPDDGQKHPGLIVIEEIWGVNAHIKNVADRFAAEGFSVLAPELLPEGLLAMITPQFQKDRSRIEGFLKLLPSRRRYAFEFRHPSWYEDDILDLLRDNDIALCISDHHDAPSPWLATARRSIP